MHFNCRKKSFSLLPLIFLGGILLSPSLLLAESFEEFTVEKVKGDSCEIKPKGYSGWKKAVEGMKQQAGSSGKTGAASTISLAFDEKNRFRILPKTEVLISTSTHDARFRKIIDLTMTEGNVEVDLDAFPEKYQFKVQTPTAVCGAIGTRFVVGSENGRKNTFQATKGTIFASSREDGSFYTGEIRSGQSLEADLAPGKENSYSELRVRGGKIPVAFGTRDRKMDVNEGSVIVLAQEHSDSANEVAMKVERGQVGGNGAGHYVLKDGKMEDLSNDQKSSDLVNQYLALAEKEGGLKARLEKEKSKVAPKSDLQQMEQELDQAAQKATEKRKELFRNRDQMRRLIRSGTEGIRNRPTSIPR
jgi:hypothetical protein